MLLFAVVISMLVPGSAVAAQGDSEDTGHHLQIRTRLRLIEHQKRADLVAYRLINALPSTVRRDSAPYIGLRIADHKAKQNALLAEALGLSEPAHPFVYSVDPTGPADAAGLQPGDEILAIDGELIREAKRFHKVVSKADLKFPLHIRALRDGLSRQFEVQQSYRPRKLEVIVVGDAKNMHAWATRKGIVITTGMLKFLENDSEIAVILGHEFGHLVRGHFSSSYLAGGFQPSFSQGLELEADRYGLELAHTAGYDPEVGINVWERFVEDRKSYADELLLSHPPTSQRIATARKVAAQLKSKAAE